MSVPLGVIAAQRTVTSVSAPIASGLVGWWDAADAASITASAGAVSQWNDKSGGGKHVVQATAGAKPTTGAATRNGRNVLVFDGGDYLAYTGSTWNTGSVTVFAAAAQTAAGDDNSGIFLIHDGTSDYNSYGCLFLSTTSASNFVEAYRYVSAAVVPGSGVMPWSQIAAVFKPDGYVGGRGGVDIYRDGVIGTFVEAAGYTPFPVATGGLLIAARWISGSVYGPAKFNGQIGEICVYNRVLTDPERQQNESYLRTKWGLP